MSRLSNAIQNVMASSGITVGRTSIKCRDLAAKYPQGIHVTAIAQNEFNGSKYFIYTFAEEPDKYFSGGKVLTEKTNQLLEAYDGDLAELNKDLSEEMLELFLAEKRGEKFTYINAGFGKTVPVNQVEAVDEETGEVIATFYEAVDEETGEVIATF